MVMTLAQLTGLLVLLDPEGPFGLVWGFLFFSLLLGFSRVFWCFSRVF